MLRKAFLNSYNKNIFVLIGKHKKISVSSFQSFNNHRPALAILQIHFSQRRFSSSNSSENVMHKVFFVNAESPPADQAFSHDTIEYIPPPPLPPEIVDEPLQLLNKLGEPTFESIGLGGWSPVGLVQSALEYLHVTAGLPWWGSIALATLVMRMALFPLVIVAQRNASKLNNVMPAIQKLQSQMTDARNSGNELDVARISYELQNFMKKEDVNPLRSMIVPFVQAPIFISMFIGLRRCANLPVESMKDGGMLWFTDLTVADPYIGLPIITSLTMLASIELGADGQMVANQNSKMIRYVLRGLPFIILPFSVQFPSAVLCYWTSSNFISLAQVGFLKIPSVREYFKIKRRINIKPEEKPGDKKGFVQEMKRSWSNMKVASEVADRHRFDEVQFKKAGTGPLVKTFKHNPVVKRSVIDVKAKIKD